MHRLPPRSAAAATSLIALVALVCVVLGAGRVLGRVLDVSDRDFTFRPKVEDFTGSPAASETQPGLDLDQGQGGDAFGTVLLVLLVIAALGVLVLILWVIRRAAVLRSERRPAAQEAEDPDALLAVEDADRALRGARDSLEYAAAPRDAVIDAWLALERGIAEAGIVRRPAQTTTEYVISVMRALDLPEADLHVLADLYGRALFDDAGIQEDSRGRARDALAHLTERLQEVTGR